MISSFSLRMAFVFPEVTSKGKHPGRISGLGGDGVGGRFSDLNELKGPSMPPLPPEREPVTSSCSSTRDCSPTLFFTQGRTNVLEIGVT